MTAPAEKDNARRRNIREGAAPAWVEPDAEIRKEFWAVLALRHCRGLGARSRARLLKIFGSAYRALQSKNSWKKAGFSQRQVDEITGESWRTEAREEWDQARKLNARILLWGDSHYPERLRELPDAPILLYCRGDVSLLRAPAIAIVGSRHATKHGCDVAAHIARRLAACGIAVSSGMAQGIDRAVHEAALEETGKSIGVLGTGIDKIYPRDNEELFTRMAGEGLLLSEFPPGAQPLAAHFPIRNRIISGLSLGVLVIEAASRSGSLITARLALEQNRDVFAVPGQALDAHSIGCQDLVRQGAQPVFTAEDILRDLAAQLRLFGISGETRPGEGDSPAVSRQSKASPDMLKNGSNGFAAQKFCALSPGDSLSAASPCPPESRHRLLECLRQHGDMQSDALAAALDLTAAELSPILVSLEITGQIKRLPGARYKVL
ncbi:MAG: DNA-processing protein DprA [Desulfovibrio sp.]|nr:DNA-processing protein DprA [Desulfovibrio sp.]